MKKIAIVFLLSQFISYSQENQTKHKVAFEPFFRLNTTFPFQNGNHSLAKDFDSKMGINANLALISYNNFNFLVGYEFSKYITTNFKNVGEINQLNYSTLYIEIDYNIEVLKKLKVIPNLGYGYVKNNYKSGSRSYGIQGGTELRLGIFFNYNFTKVFSTYIGIHYINSNLKINTSQEYEDYFGKANRFQLSLGIKFE